MRLLVIDGNSIVNRAFYGVRALANHKGVFTNALFGFIQMYLKETAEVRPDAVAVAFDLHAPTFRHKAASYYKANRKGMPEELAMQMPYLKEILADMGIAVLSAEGFEADDILGTLAGACDAQGAECFVMTGDRDSLQLISDHVTVRLVKTKETVAYTPERFREEYGFAPVGIIDLKALMGDSSDNIPGIKGVGEKSAMPLIQTWGTIENMYDHISEVQGTEKFRQKLLDGRHDAEESKWLATIVRNAPVPLDLDAYKPKPQNTDALRRLLTELEMYKILDRFHLAPLASEETPEETGDMQALVPEDDFTLPVHPWDAAAVAAASPAGYVLHDGKLTVCTGDAAYETESEAEILAFLSSPQKKAADDAKAHYHYALERGTALAGIVFDAAVCGYLLNPSATDYSVAALCAKLHVPYHENLGALADVQALPALYAAGIAKLERDGMTALWRDVELPLTRVLASMEHAGVLVDPEGIRSFGERLTGRIAELQAQHTAEREHHALEHTVGQAIEGLPEAASLNAEHLPLLHQHGPVESVGGRAQGSHLRKELLHRALLHTEVAGQESHLAPERIGTEGCEQFTVDTHVAARQWAASHKRTEQQRPVGHASAAYCQHLTLLKGNADILHRATVVVAH